MTATTIKTAYDLKYAVEAANPSSKFFTPNNMRFAGDRMSNYGVCKATIETYQGPVECWELFRKKPVKHGLQRSAYFDCETFAQRWPKA